MKKMLEYQALDIELANLKKNSINSDDRINMQKIKEYMVETHNKAYKLEDSGKELIAEYEKLKDQYNKNCDKIQKLTNTDINSISLDAVDEYLSTINSLSSELFLLERNINIIITKIKSSLKEFEFNKNNLIKAKKKHDEYKLKCEQDLQKVAPKIQAIENKMKEMEKSLNPTLFAKYKELKADKIKLPVFVKVENGHCGGCRVELPSAKVNKLKADGTIVCECHRIIYND